MKAPGTAYDDPRIGRDPQPAQHERLRGDRRGQRRRAHQLGIPNHAFYLASIGFGGSAWVKAGKVWYLALTQSLHRDADFMVAASATVDAAGRQFGDKGATVVRSAWKQVGIEVQSASPRKAKASGADDSAGEGGRATCAFTWSRAEDSPGFVESTNSTPKRCPKRRARA
jgi:hypothetical protein